MPKSKKPNKPMKKKESVEQQIAKAFAHPLRVQILIVLNERNSSPNLLSKELGKSLNLVAYHVRVLEKYKCVELVETKQRRGATEHFYKATRRQFLAIPMEADEQGWRDAATLLDETRERLAEIQSEAQQRLAAEGRRGLLSKVAIMHFQSPPELAGNDAADE